MDLKELNDQIAQKLGWEEYGMGFSRLTDGFQETAQRLPDYTSNLQLAQELWKHAAKCGIEFSMYMVLYTGMPVFMASFIRGQRQFTGKDSEPSLAIAKAFAQVMTYAP